MRKYQNEEGDLMYYPRIKEIRVDNDHTQQYTADALKISQQQYQLYESGKRDLPIDLLQKFCILYQISADYILELPKGMNWPR